MKVKGLPRDLSPPLLCPILTLLLTLLQATLASYCSSNTSYTILPQGLYTYSTHCLEHLPLFSLGVAGALILCDHHFLSEALSDYPSSKSLLILSSSFSILLLVLTFFWNFFFYLLICPSHPLRAALSNVVATSQVWPFKFKPVKHSGLYKCSTATCG